MSVKKNHDITGEGNVIHFSMHVSVGGRSRRPFAGKTGKSPCPPRIEGSDLE
jgi:hypothetical protein